MLNVGIIGAGKGGTSILKTLLTVNNLNIFGICDINFDSPGIKLAETKDIPIYNDFKDLFSYSGEKIIIEVTGNDNIRNRLSDYSDKETVILDSAAALLISNIVNSREKMISELKSESHRLGELASNLSASIQETTAVSAKNNEELNQTMKKLLETANKNQTSIEETNEIISFIKKVATQTKMLGFNAAIEANRAGNEGRGFSVVANEIRTLADNTGESVHRITQLIDELTDATTDTLSDITKMKNQTASFIKTQQKITDTLDYVSNHIDELTSLLNELTEI